MSILETGLTVAEARSETFDREVILMRLHLIDGSDLVRVASEETCLDTDVQDQEVAPRATASVALDEDLSLDEIDLDTELREDEIDLDIDVSVEAPPDAPLLYPSTSTQQLITKFGETLLIRRLNEDCANLAHVLLSLESSQLANSFPEILVGTTLVELGLGGVLHAPPIDVIGEIIRAQKRHNKRYKTETMEKWATGDLETSLGVLIMLLCGIRWALSQNSSQVGQFLNERFRPDYQSIVRDSSLTKSLETIRRDYRNPAHHGRRVEYGRPDYEKLILLSTGCGTVSEWLKTLDPKPFSADIGVLHNHLILSR